MYNHLINNINYNGYDITIRHSDINGMYQLSCMVESMGLEYRESMISDTNPLQDYTILDKFIRQIEHNK